MNKQRAEFLSHCVCAKKKTDKSKKKQHSTFFLIAEKVIYSYESRHYFTPMDIFSEFLFCKEIKSEDEVEVITAFDKFCTLFSVPETIFSDNGKNFSLFEVERNTTPAQYPPANGKIENFHRELGKSGLTKLFLYYKLQLKKPFF